MTLLEIRNASKGYGGLDAVRDATLAIGPGEAVALVGENGAGKTTLMRLVAGIVPADSGTISAGGVRIDDAAGAARAGIEMMQQHFDLAGALSVAENIVLRERGLPALYGRRLVERFATELVARSGIDFRDLGRPASTLSVGEMARIELIRALARHPRILILDEPTSVLTPGEVGSLLARLRELAAAGMAVILISHRLTEVFQFASRIVIMREGGIVADAPAGSITEPEVARLMIGRELQPPGRRRSKAPGDERLRLDSIDTSQRDHGVPLRSVSLVVRGGETAAIVGVAGNGQNALADLLRGVIRSTAGRIAIDGVALDTTALYHDGRVAHIPGDRTRDGIVAEMTLAENLALRASRWRAGSAARAAAGAIERFRIRGASRQAAGSLSGGNQQKLILARELGRGTPAPAAAGTAAPHAAPSPELIVASEPTRGLDFDAAAFVREELREAAARGAAILLLTSDLDEAAELADSLYVMSGGSLSPRLAPSTPAEELGMRMAGAR